jgi:hypothetical protein
MACYTASAQRSMEGFNDFEFETTKSSGNRNFIKYSAFNFHYSRINYSLDSRDKTYEIPYPSFGISFEGYNTLTRKIAGSSQVGFNYFNGNYALSLDYGLYFILIKGLYLKPMIGYSLLSDSDTGELPYVFNYGGDVGYNFQVRGNGQGRPLFVGLFGSYRAFTGSKEDYEANYTNKYSGGGFGAGLKLMWGPRQR